MGGWLLRRMMESAFLIISLSDLNLKTVTITSCVENIGSEEKAFVFWYVRSCG